MNFDIEKNITIFNPIFERRPEISKENLKQDLRNYYLPYIQKLIDKKKQRKNLDGLIVGISAIQGAGKTTQGEVLEILLKFLGYTCVSLSIDDHYVTHEELNKLREKGPRFIRRGATHDILRFPLQFGHWLRADSGRAFRSIPATPIVGVKSS